MYYILKGISNQHIFDSADSTDILLMIIKFTRILITVSIDKLMSSNNYLFMTGFKKCFRI